MDIAGKEHVLAELLASGVEEGPLHGAVVITFYGQSITVKDHHWPQGEGLQIVGGAHGLPSRTS
jgi:hypothetical protein